MFNTFESGEKYYRNAQNAELGFERRVLSLQRTFEEIFQRPPELIARAPGRIELLGNHTDYNQGITLSATIDSSLCAAFAKNEDKTFRIVSRGVNDKDSIVIIDPHSIKKSAEHAEDEWTNYFKGVIAQLDARFGDHLHGCDMYLESTIPSGGGFSSSAALELAVAQGIIQMNNIDTLRFDQKQPILRMELVQIARESERGPFVGANTGFLDQSTIANGNIVFLDYQPNAQGHPVSAEALDSHFDAQGLTFMVGIDPDLKHNLAHQGGGYNIRVQECTLSLEYITRISKKHFSTLRQFADIRKSDINMYRTTMEQLKLENERYFRRVVHVVTEIDRVSEGLKALKNGGAQRFGTLMKESGWSALHNYNIDDYDTEGDISELRWTYETGCTLPTVIGLRNMGGGFNNTTLWLVDTNSADEIAEKMKADYKAKFGLERRLNFLTFNISPGVGTFQTIR